ncbi:polysaccharide biosynthesis tyrosine autokinase [Gordonia sp. AC31]|uniref:polysaccharide biosynthesis tyrosine autokinase n=1 Tax=Gordonia sp. AC31 TaxID=2962571 RepID=UPI0028813C92|nr:polysaccharide biosynthesis tyrosine autokinase [Gordonia sp. AC31]MDT0223432.1 polysaccharide biosynthesis tyrosine autokinase [Gordonia sp. AC31]
MSGSSSWASLQGSSLPGLVRLFVERWWVLVGSCLLGALIGLSVSLIQTPMYSSAATLYVTASGESGAQSAYQGALASEQRVTSYAELASSRLLVEEALASSGLALDVSDARAAVSAVAIPDTVLVQVSAELGNPELAARLANAVAESLVRYAQNLEKPNDGSEPLAKLTVVSPAEAASEPVTPLTNRNVAFAAFIGLLLSALGVVLADRLDNRIRSDSEIAEEFGQVVLAAVPADASLKTDGPIDFGTGGHASAEAFRKLRTNLSFVGVDQQTRTLLVTSPREGDGKTTTSVNLACALAEAGSRVLLVDADLRRGRLASVFGLMSGIGLTTLLTSPDFDGDGPIQNTGEENLWVLASGPRPPNPAELLGTKRAEDVFAGFADAFDYVIVDSPPILPVTDSVVMSRFVDGVVVVVRAGRTRGREMSTALGELDAGRARVLGVVVNELNAGADSLRYSYYGYATNPSPA